MSTYSLALAHRRRRLKWREKLADFSSESSFDFFID